MHQVKARKQGGAVVITIPATLLKLRDIKAGDTLGLDLLPDGFSIRKALQNWTTLSMQGSLDTARERQEAALGS